MGLRRRFRILDFERVLQLLGGVGAAEFRRHYEGLINERIAKEELSRQPQWTEAIAVGTEKFVRQIAEETRGERQLGIEGAGETWTLKKLAAPYRVFSGSKTTCKDLCDR